VSLHLSFNCSVFKLIVSSLSLSLSVRFGLQTRRKPRRLHRLRPYQLHRDEQALGPTPTLRPLSRTSEARARAKGASHPRRHQPRPAQSARRSRSRDVPEDDPAERAGAGRQLQGCDRTGVSHGGRHPGSSRFFRSNPLLSRLRLRC
jgi:hypothetical protein